VTIVYASVCRLLCFFSEEGINCAWTLCNAVHRSGCLCHCVFVRGNACGHTYPFHFFTQLCESIVAHLVIPIQIFLLFVFASFAFIFFITHRSAFALFSGDGGRIPVRILFVFHDREESECVCRPSYKNDHATNDAPGYDVFSFIYLVVQEGLEPPCLAAVDLKSTVSAVPPLDHVAGSRILIRTIIHGFNLYRALPTPIKSAVLPLDDTGITV
jgi:hypothetical protein